MEILSFNSWWESLSILSKVYWIIAISASAIFLIQIVMTFIGADSDSGGMDATGDADASIDTDHGIGFQLISLKNLIGFFTIFGWSGIACLDSDLSIPLTIGISLFCGLLMMAIMASIFYFMGKLVESGNVVMASIVGKTGTVYLVIPASRKTAGKIQIQHQGYRTIDAMTDDTEDIPTGSVIQVTAVINDELLLVKKV
ncbi:hypothetical protein CYCD_04550 [Tenuifilaceae bacterium CYCD]|nr:hypothetical protein CYCD_04550 [Tenuifilaceae bacterium CYCD]